MPAIDYNTVLAEMKGGNPGPSGIGWDGPYLMPGQSLNSLGVGVAKNNTPENGTVANGYPTDNWAGVIETMEWGAGTSLIQRATPISKDQVAYGFWIRVLWDTWTPWRFIPTQRVDNTAGKAIYTWDNTANKEVLIHGDTGWRSIGPLMPTWLGGHVLFRRTMGLIELIFESAQFSDAVDKAIALPLTGSVATLTGHSPIPSAATALGPHRLEWAWDGNHRLYKTSETGFRGYASFPTRAPWPTTLPGTAFAS